MENEDFPHELIIFRLWGDSFAQVKPQAAVTIRANGCPYEHCVMVVI